MESPIANQVYSLGKLLSINNWLPTTMSGESSL